MNALDARAISALLDLDGVHVVRRLSHHQQSVADFRAGREAHHHRLQRRRKETTMTSLPARRGPDEGAVLFNGSVDLTRQILLRV